MRPHPALVFTVIFVFIFLLHLPLLQLPYFWDEAGYYIPAARDILVTGSLIPHSTLSNAHPPLVLAWLALWWKFAGYAPLVTRSAMLMVAAFSLTGVFRLAERVANLPVAVGATLCTALYPVFFAQSSLAQVDLAAAGLTFWGLSAYLEDRPITIAIWFSLAVLAKETAIIAPAALVAWEVIRWLLPQSFRRSRSTRLTLALLFPLLPLLAWYAYHYARTGYIFGNPEFFRYNVADTLNFTRFLLALGLRLWQALGYLHLWLLTLGMMLAMLLPPFTEAGMERPRITVPVQLSFYAIMAAYVIAMALIGGAVLARYMLPTVPLLIIVAVSTLWRRLRYWPVAVGGVALAFVVAWFWNPPYGFSPEDNLAYRDYANLHEDGERFLEARYPMARVLTAWPAADELTRPWLGYITRPMQVVRIENFSLDEVLSAADFRSNFEVALVFSTKYEAAHPLLGLWNMDHWRKWEEWKTRFFGFHRDLPPPAVAQILGGRIVFAEERKGQWIAVIELERVENARLPAPDVEHAEPSGSHQMARVRLDHQPDFAARDKSERISGGKGKVDFHLNAAVHTCRDNHVALLQ
jgi:hypothetical protein